MTTNVNVSIIDELEEQLGNNLHILRDGLDLAVRQGNGEIIKALRDIEQAWDMVALLAATERHAKKNKLTFNAVHEGNSVIDSLFHYATEIFPRSVPAQVVKLKRINTALVEALEHIRGLAKENTHSPQDGYATIEEWARKALAQAKGGAS